MNYRIALTISLMLVLGGVCNAETQPVQERDRSPKFFRVHSQNGNETFQVDCTAPLPDTITCRFMGARINLAKKRDISSQVQAFKRLSLQEQNTLQEEFAKDSEGKTTIESLQNQLNDPAVGPMKKKFIQEIILAQQTGDLLRSLEAMASKEQRTCTVDTQSFSLSFKRIGTWKWVSNPGPGGLCNFVKVYELLGEPLRADDGEILSVQWKMTETRVAGDTTRPLCEDAEKELNKPIVWSWRFPNEYELPCEFLKFGSLLQH